MITAPQQWLHVFLVLACCGPALARPPELPDPVLTPGALNATVRQDNIDDTICSRGWTRTIRPPAGFTNTLKHRQIRDYGYADTRMRNYEEDHLVPLELGGAPDDPANLWPQPRDGQWTAADKDKLESQLRKRVCKHKLSLAQAQAMIRDNWVEAFQKLRLRPLAAQTGQH